MKASRLKPFLIFLIFLSVFSCTLKSGKTQSCPADSQPTSLTKYSTNYSTKEEQKKISAVISASLQEIKLLETKLDYLQQEKKALMQQLLTGKRRVKIAV